MKTFGLFLATAFFALVLGATSALACRGAIGVYSVNNQGSVQCTLTGEDENWCYYDCTCSGTPTVCDRLYAAAGLIDV